MTEKKIAVVAFGGNALLRSDQDGTQEEQQANSDVAAERLVEFIRNGYELLVVHGNGPQVGNIVLQQEAKKDKIHPYTLDYCVAMTQGSMGFMLENSIRYAFAKEKIEKDVITIVTQVIVDKSDPGFHYPTKPVGPFYSTEAARKLISTKGWSMVEDSGRGWRKVVASPKPVEVVSEKHISELIHGGSIVIAAGGGGIPVYINEEGHLTGIEAVIDKDYASSLLGSRIGAELFVILTEVEEVYINFGKPNQEAVRTMSIEDARKYRDQGQFPPGSMGPKIQAAIDFIKAGGKEVIITKAETLADAIAGKNGTKIIAGDTN
jgi:carbamate kinase